MADFERRAKRCPTDLTDEEWSIVRPLLPAASKRGRGPTTDLREVLNALRYMARSGGGWRMLPRIFHDGKRSIGDSVASCAGCCLAPHNATWPLLDRLLFGARTGDNRSFLVLINEPCA
jgi:hypothetical protein